MPDRRFPPRSVEELDACFVVRATTTPAKLLTKDEGRRIATNIAKLPEIIAEAKNVLASIDARDLEED
jgi:hypothetical protein